MENQEKTKQINKQNKERKSFPSTQNRVKKQKVEEIVEEEIELSYDEILKDLKTKEVKIKKPRQPKVIEEVNEEPKVEVKEKKAVIERRIIAPKQKPEKVRASANRPFRNLKNIDDAPISKELSNKAQFQKDNLKIMFLGGTGEIGKNMTVIEYGEDIIVVDAGLTFPTDDMPGIDLVIPDITYLVQNKHRVKAIFLTHGHEDHIGGLPYVLNEIKCPIYATKLTLALIENKFREHTKTKYTAHTIEPRKVTKVGCFSVEALKVSHSISGSVALSITTPVGVIFHTGDFKIDYEPIDNEMTDLPRMAEIGNKGVLLLMCESTNVERHGHSMSERRVGENLDILFERNIGKRLFIATFASNIYRTQQILDLAEKYNRKVAFTGRSMINNMETASKVNALVFNKQNIIDIDQISNYPDAELCIITTGSQGEPMSALTRIANGEFNKVQVGENDCIILSSSPIPGNEKAVNNTINSLFKKNADVVYNELVDVHTSGHAYQDELKIVHRLIRPKYFIPIHGEYKHFKHHKDLAVNMGMNENNVILPDIGMCVELDGKDLFRQAGYVPSGTRLVDGTAICDFDNAVLKDRKALSEDGICVAIAVIDRKKNRIVNGPEFITRGLIYSNEAFTIVDEAKEVIRTTILQSDLKAVDNATLKNNIRKALNNYFSKKNRRNPTILVAIYDAQ